MDNNNNNNNNGHYNGSSLSGSSGPITAPTITEYKREFQWNPPLYGPKKVIKQEPMMSSYQSEFGRTITGEFYSMSQPTSLTNSFNGHDTVDSGLMYNSMMNFASIPSSTTVAKSATAPSTPPSVNHRKSPLQRPFSPVGGGSQKDVGNQKRPASASARSPTTTAIKSTPVSFNQEPERPSKTELTTEYHSKFRDFNEYVYLEGQGVFCEASILRDPQLAKKAKEWYAEKEERQKQACNYRARSLLGVNSRHPEYTWDGVKVKDRELEALALATRLRLEEKKRSKLRTSSSCANNSSGVSSIASTRSASARPTKRSSTTNYNNDHHDINSIVGSKLNSAPASLQDDRTMSKPAPIVQRSTKSIDKNNNNTKQVQSAKNTGGGAGAGSQVTSHQSTTGVSNKPVSIKKKIFIRKQAAPQSSTNDESGGGGGGSSVREFDPEPKSVPLKTTQIKSPEQITGVKSPSPESWKVTIEKGGLDWVDGGGGGGGGGKNTGTGSAEAAGLQQQPVNFVDNSSIAKQAYLSTNADQMIRPIPINGAAKMTEHAFHGPL